MFNLVRICLIACGLAATWTAHAQPHKEAPAVALYYGAKAPLDDLKVFDIVVVDADHGYSPASYGSQTSELYAYAALTEVHPTRPYFNQIPAAWQLGKNADWNSVLVDQSQASWPEFFADQVIGPLWAKGFRGFFIDTLDSYRLAKEFDEQQQQDGVVAVVNQLHQRFPGIKLILNRGFEVLPRIKDKVQMVAAESLFQGWNANRKQYGPVSTPDREWLQQQLVTARDQLGIPGLVIDYVPPGDRKKTRETAKQIQDLGFTPWVTDHQLHTVGVGTIELVPRRVAVLYNGTEYPALNYSAAHRFLQLPLNHLGYLTDYFDIAQALPEGIHGDRYAGVVTWFGGAVPSHMQVNLQRWLYQAMQQKLPFASLGAQGFDTSAAWVRALGLVQKPASSGALTVVHRDPMLQFEMPILPADRNNYVTDVPPGDQGFRALITLQDSKQQTFSAGAITPWGGYIRNPYVVQSLPGTEDDRWVVDPFAFVQQALQLAALPAPDVTTENGRRLLFAHIDGDAFPSKAEMPGNRFAADWLLTDILQKYRIPHAVSVIEAEVSAQGLYPQHSAHLEDIAKRMFALPHVEVASHTYSHPYLWNQSVRHGLFADNKEAAVNLNIPGYKMDLQREIVGSIDYIQNRLAGGKPVKILLWSGDTAPGADALKIIHDNGLLNMNGGDTSINRSNPSLTAVMGHGITKDGYLQIYAPITNENIYTNLWLGPYYGYERVIETFQMTESPRRLKAADIYYHTYAASKQASLNSLHKAYTWAMQQPLHPVYPSEYIRKVQDFYTMALAKDRNGWRIRTSGELRTVRIPQSWGAVDLQRSQNIAGFAANKDENYVHLTGGDATLRLTPSDSTSSVALWDANARLQKWTADAHSASFHLQGHVPLEFSLRARTPCQVRANGAVLKALSQTSVSGTVIQRFRSPHAAASFQAQCSAS